LTFFDFRFALLRREILEIAKAIPFNIHFLDLLSETNLSSKKTSIIELNSMIESKKTLSLTRPTCVAERGGLVPSVLRLINFEYH